MVHVKVLGAAGGMMRFVGFAILLKVMVSKELMGLLLLRFALANIVSASESLAGSALVLLAFIGLQLHTGISKSKQNSKQRVLAL